MDKKEIKAKIDELKKDLKEKLTIRDKRIRKDINDLKIQKLTKQKKRHSYDRLTGRIREHTYFKKLLEDINI